MITFYFTFILFSLLCSYQTIKHIKDEIVSQKLFFILQSVDTLTPLTTLNSVGIKRGTGMRIAERNNGNGFRK